MTDTALPQRIPVFPLAGAVVFPRGRLPLHIFEPRYRAMIRDALEGDGLIGMVQPRNANEPPALYEVGGLGRITECSETNDGRYLIELGGVTRFRIARELKVETPYRQVEADYAGFSTDTADADPLMPALRAAVEQELKNYLDNNNLSADWNAISGSDDETLVNSLATVCPFAPPEKQALLETAGLPDRARLLLQLMQFASTGPEQPETLQ